VRGSGPSGAAPQAGCSSAALAPAQQCRSQRQRKPAQGPTNPKQLRSAIHSRFTSDHGSNGSHLARSRQQHIRPHEFPAAGRAAKAQARGNKHYQPWLKLTLCSADWTSLVKAHYERLFAIYFRSNFFSLFCSIFKKFSPSLSLLSYCTYAALNNNLLQHSRDRALKEQRLLLAQPAHLTLPPSSCLHIPRRFAEHQKLPISLCFSSVLDTKQTVGRRSLLNLYLEPGLRIEVSHQRVLQLILLKQ